MTVHRNPAVGHCVTICNTQVTNVTKDSKDNTKNRLTDTHVHKNFTYRKEIYAYFYKTNGKIDQKRLDYFFTKACK